MKRLRRRRVGSSGATRVLLALTTIWQALARFAKALCDSLVANDWDGYDIDWEIGSSVFDMDGTLSTNADLVYLVKEMNKHIGPKSDPDRQGPPSYLY